MKKIINGAKYDTSTAKKLAEWSNNLSRSDFNCMEETLYRTKSGKYFLYGEGHGRSRYASQSGNMWGWGQKIISMSRTAAMEWAEENLDGDEYEEIFGEVSEDANTEQLNVTIPAALKARLWELAEDRKITVAVLAVELLGKATEKPE